jgi:hypothetical protein
MAARPHQIIAKLVTKIVHWGDWRMLSVGSRRKHVQEGPFWIQQGHNQGCKSVAIFRGAFEGGISERGDARLHGSVDDEARITFGLPLGFQAHSHLIPLKEIVIRPLGRITQIRNKVSELFEPGRTDISEQTLPLGQLFHVDSQLHLFKRVVRDRKTYPESTQVSVTDD